MPVNGRPYPPSQSPQGHALVLEVEEYPLYPRGRGCFDWLSSVQSKQDPLWISRILLP